MLDLAVAAVGVLRGGGLGGRDEAALRRHAQQGDVAVVFQQLGGFMAVGQHEVLHDKFYVHYAAAGVFDVLVVCGVAGGDFLAHGEDVDFQAAYIARLGDDLAAQLFKLRAELCAAADVAGAGERLVFPCPCVLLLVLGVGGEAVDQEAAVAVGAQAQVQFVKAACACAAG